METRADVKIIVDDFDLCANRGRFFETRFSKGPTTIIMCICNNFTLYNKVVEDCSLTLLRNSRHDLSGWRNGPCVDANSLLFRTVPRSQESIYVYMIHPQWWIESEGPMDSEFSLKQLQYPSQAQLVHVKLLLKNIITLLLKCPLH